MALWKDAKGHGALGILSAVRGPGERWGQISRQPFSNRKLRRGREVHGCGAQTPVLDLVLCSQFAVGLRARVVSPLTLRLLISPVSVIEEGSLGCFDNFEISYAWCLSGAQEMLISFP